MPRWPPLAGSQRHFPWGGHLAVVPGPVHGPYRPPAYAEPLAADHLSRLVGMSLSRWLPLTFVLASLAGLGDSASFFNRRLHCVQELFMILFHMLGEIWKDLNSQSI